MAFHMTNHKPDSTVRAVFTRSRGKHDHSDQKIAKM